MSIPRSKCSHILTIGDYTKDDIIAKQQNSCDVCKIEGPFHWVCLHRNCLFVGCNTGDSNHCLKHFLRCKEHSIFLNLTSLRVYCLLCECEVFLENNDPPLPGMLPAHPHMNKIDSDSDDYEENDENVKPKGLTGLQNLGNTCYMNSAIQALSNCPQLTNFFLQCESFVRCDKKSGLSKSYMRLMKEMWHKKRPSYVVPSGVAYGIKIVCPVFRGYAQQDAQEFLRCFMDQLHEELKEPSIEMLAISSDGHEGFDVPRTDSGMPASEDSSQSDAEYETCDSVSNSDKGSFADEGVYSEEANTESVELMDSITLDSVSCPSKSTPILEQIPDHQFFPTISPEPHLIANDDPRSEGVEHFALSPIADNQIKKSDISTCNFKNSSPIDYPIVHRRNEAIFTAREKSQGDKCDTLLGNISIPDKDICDTTAELKLEETEAIKHFNSIKYSSLQNVECDDYTDFKPKVSRDSQSSQSSLKDSLPVKQNNSQFKHLFNFNMKRRKSTQFRSIISDTFDGKILSSVQCLTCDTVSTTKETFQDLSLPIPTRDHLHMLHASHQKSGGTCTDVYSHQGWFSSLFGWVMSWFWGPSVSLQDCLAAFFSADELKGDNMYSCEKCKKLRNGIKYSKVIQLPEVLCVHLKRFRHEVMFSSKISSYVSFPLEGLDMSQFLHKSYPYGVTTYDLSAVICHHGTVGSGHYTSYCLNYLNDQWYEFDDQYVTAVDAEMVRHCEAYVLFYRKCPEDMIKKRQCAVELMERSQHENSLLKFHISKQWINKFNNFAEPGPITNTDFLCVHGGVPPSKAHYADELCTVIPQAVWEYLHESFGGGPPCTHLYICSICQTEQDNRNSKRRKELEDFTALHAEFQHLENPSVVYAISMSWFKTWENFVCKNNEPPGPIDNSSICYIKNNQAVLKLGSDYCSVSKEMYLYLLNIYGGGPDIVSHNFPQISSVASPKHLQHSTSSHPSNVEILI